MYNNVNSVLSDLILGFILQIGIMDQDISGSQVWWCMPVILALRRRRQEDHRFEASLSNLDPQQLNETLFQNKK